MGLDIYVRWDGISAEEMDAQITGFVDAPEFGYFRASWPAYAFLRETAAAMGVILPAVGSHALGNGGDDQVVITDEVMAQLCEWRQHWLDATKLPVPIREAGDEEFFRMKLRNSAAMVDFVEKKRAEGVTGLIIGYW